VYVRCSSQQSGPSSAQSILVLMRHIGPALTIVHKLPASKVSVRLNEELFVSKQWKRRQMLILCTEYELLLKKDLRRKKRWKSNLSKNKNSKWRKDKRRSKLYAQIKMLAIQIEPNLLLTEYIKSSGLGQLYPQVGKQICKQSFSQSYSLKYFEHLSALNQILTTSNDLPTLALNKDKYIAHKLSLLYSLLTHLGGMSPLEAKLETMFQGIKNSSSLSAEQKEWIINLTEEVKNNLSHFPPSVLDKIKPLFQFLNNV